MPAPGRSWWHLQTPPAKKKGSRRSLKNGAGEETRTLDVHLGKVVLYQLSYARETGSKE
jgi:hypothetical protein